jgi:GcrA cell cycle regulator
MTWTPEKLELMRTLWLEGNSASVIGEQLGVTKNAVIGMVFRLKIRRAPNTPRFSLPEAREAAKPKPKPKLAPPRKPPPPPPRPRWVSLMELRVDSCRYPRDGATGVEFCSAVAPFLSPWCPEHRALCYRRSIYEAAAE